MKLLRPVLLSVSAALVLAGCGSSGTDSIVPTPLSVSSSAQPQLGSFSAGATVTYLMPDGSTIASALTGSNGQAVVDLGSYTGPFTVRVSGAPGVTYFDESDGSNKPFGTGAVMLAIVKGSAGGLNTVGVTPLTHAAARLAGVTAASPSLGSRTTADIDTANGQVAAMFGLPVGFDITRPPSPVTAGATSLTGSDDAPTYAAVLAALAIEARASGASALARSDAMGAAFAATGAGESSSVLAGILGSVRALMAGEAVGGVTLASRLTIAAELASKLNQLAPTVLTNGRVPLASEVSNRVTLPPCPPAPTGATGATGATGGTGASGGSGLGNVVATSQNCVAR
jgi:hypothetical protein